MISDFKNERNYNSKNGQLSAQLLFFQLDSYNCIFNYYHWETFEDNTTLGLQ